MPLEKAWEDAMVASGQNGEALRPEQGYPMRRLLPGWEGDANVKWLHVIKGTDKPYHPLGYPLGKADGKACRLGIRRHDDDPT